MLVYAYGAKAPLNPEPVLEQLRQANQYRNRLIEIEEARRRATKAYLAEALPPEKLAQEAELKRLIDNAFAAVRGERKTTRSRVKMAPAQRDEVAAWKVELAAVRRELRDIRAGMRVAKPAPCLQGKCSKRKRCKQCRDAVSMMDLGPLGNIDAIAHAANLTARAEYASGKLYHGTYIAVEEAAKTSFAKTPLGDIGQDRDLRFSKFDGSGCVGVQLQGGLPLADIATGTRMQVLTMDQTDWRPSGPNPNLAHWRLLRLRIASVGRDPVWADFPFRMHRALPEGCSIMWAYVHRKRIGTTFRWSVQFTVKPLLEPIAHPFPEKVCGIDIGWRKMDEGLRVAVLMGDTQESITLPLTVLQQFDKPCGIRAVRDKNFNEAVLLAQSLKPLWPEWLQEAGKHMGHWRKSARLAWVVLRWRNERFTGDEEVFAHLEEWRKQDRHLLEMESHLRQRAQNARLHRYRNWALSVCQRYGRVILEGRDVDVKMMDLRPLAELPAEDSPRDPLPQAAREYRTWAACSILRKCLEQAALKTGATIYVTPARYTTMACTICGVVDTVDRESLVVTCRHCTESQDQDVRAALNIASAKVPQ